MIMKKTNHPLRSWLLAAVLTLGSTALSYGQEPYFNRAQMPDLIQCLPAPPDTAGPDFAHDILRYFWGKTQRLDAERAAMADRDAAWTREGLLGVFEEAFGIPLSPEGTPAIWGLMDNSIATVDSIRIAPKAYYHRKRPFERFNEPLLTAWEEEGLRGDGSYPSGHAMRGYLTALLSEIHPEASNALFARGWEYCESRVIAGAHWQSDVDAGRIGAAIAFARLQTSPRFQAELEAARQEFRRLSSGPGLQPAAPSPSNTCAARARVEGEADGIKMGGN